MEWQEESRRCVLIRILRLPLGVFVIDAWAAGDEMPSHVREFVSLPSIAKSSPVDRVGYSIPVLKQPKNHELGFSRSGDPLRCAWSNKVNPFAPGFNGAAHREAVFGREKSRIPFPYSVVWRNWQFFVRVVTPYSARPFARGHMGGTIPVVESGKLKVSFRNILSRYLFYMNHYPRPLGIDKSLGVQSSGFSILLRRTSVFSCRLGQFPQFFRMFVESLGLVLDCKQRPDSDACPHYTDNCEDDGAIQNGAIDGISDLLDRYLWRESRHLYFVILAGDCWYDRVLVRSICRGLAG